MGSHLCEALLENGAKVSSTLSLRKEGKNFLAENSDIEFYPLDLRESGALDSLIKEFDFVFHLAAVIGGIEFNIRHPARIFRDNMQMNLSILESCRKNPPEKILLLSSACVYPRYCSLPTPEEEGFKDRPEPTNEGYGWSKRMLEYAGQAYAEEFNLNLCVARPYNAYGPRDNFNPNESHVIPSLISRIYQGEEPLEVWGDGKQSRSFIHVTDVVKGLLLLMEKKNDPAPVNLGSCEEIQIRDLVQMILKISGKKNSIRYNPEKPTGQPRRLCDTQRAQQELGFQAQTPLREGLQKTIQWYEKHLQP